MAWLSWEKVCRSRSNGGLGVPDLDCKNIALLGKWWDRFGKEDQCLWKRVLVDKYYGGGNAWDITQIQVRNVSTLWRNIVALGNEGMVGSRVFRDGFSWKLGLGDKIKFWWDSWVGTEPLHISFPRLLNLANNRDATITEVGHLLNASWIWKNEWRHEPFGRERNKEQRLKGILMDGIVMNSQPDQRIWSFDHVNGYSAGKAYSLFINQNGILEPRICKRLWGGLIPTKISCFGWRLLLNGLPTKVGLLKRGITLEEIETTCCICNRDSEDENHPFVKCPMVQSLCMRCYKWWGICLSLPNSVSTLCDTHNIGIKNLVKANVWFLIFLVVAWSIWFSRNSIVYNSQQWDEDRVFDLIQRRTFAWIRGRSTHTVFPFAHWCNFGISLIYVYKKLQKEITKC
ncbi:hypothetical protein SLA2020_017650 [Shorea laevis]